jgi:hypothetical protein
MRAKGKLHKKLWSNGVARSRDQWKDSNLNSPKRGQS